MRRLLHFLLLAAATSLGAAPAFPLKVSADGRTLTDSAGTPFFYHADTAWALTRNATLAEADEYFAQRAKDGFTAIHLHAVTKEVGPVKNVNGDEPFAPLDDILKPNEAYWRHVDGVLEAAEKRGLLAAVSALWIRWGGRDKEGWRHQLTDANASAYGEFLGRRYAARKNVMWILGGDDNPHEDRAAIALMGRALKAAALLEGEIFNIVANPPAFFADELRAPLARAIYRPAFTPRAELPLRRLRSDRSAVGKEALPRSAFAPWRQWGEGLEAEAVKQMANACALPSRPSASPHFSPPPPRRWRARSCRMRTSATDCRSAACSRRRMRSSLTPSAWTSRAA